MPPRWKNLLQSFERRCLILVNCGSLLLPFNNLRIKKKKKLIRISFFKKFENQVTLSYGSDCCYSDHIKLGKTSDFTENYFYFVMLLSIYSIIPWSRNRQEIFISNDHKISAFFLGNIISVFVAGIYEISTDTNYGAEYGHLDASNPFFFILCVRSATVRSAAITCPYFSELLFLHVLTLNLCLLALDNCQ